MKIISHRGSAMATTLFLMFGMLTMAVIATEIITSGLQRQRAEGASAKAFYAAEAGVEWAALQFKLNGHGQVSDLFTACRVGDVEAEVKYLNSDLSCPSATPENETAATIKLFGSDNLPKYSVKFDIEDNVPLTNQVTINGRGSFQGTNRELKVFFCVPYCGGSGGSDGCGGSCAD